MDDDYYYEIAEGEQYAEFVSSWVSGGGSSYDAATAWASGIAYSAGYGYAPNPQVEDEMDFA